MDLQKAIRLATLNPAQVVKMNGDSKHGSRPLGSLQAGGSADLVVMSARGEVRRTIIRGAGI